MTDVEEQLWHVELIFLIFSLTTSQRNSLTIISLTDDWHHVIQLIESIPLETFFCQVSSAVTD